MVEQDLLPSYRLQSNDAQQWLPAKGYAHSALLQLLFGCSVTSDSLWPHEPQHARLPCPSPTPRACSNSCPSSRWCHPTISSCHPFSSSLQSFPASGSFPVSQFFASSGQSIGASASALVSPSKDYSRLISFRFDWFDLPAVQGILKNLLQHHGLKASILWHSVFFMVQLSHPYMTIGKIIALTIQIFVSKVISLLFHMLSRFVIAFLPRSKHLLISWLQLPSAVILEPKKGKSVTVSIVSPFICNEVMEPDAMILVFWMLSFKPAFSLSSFTFIKRLFSSSLSAIREVSSAYLRLLVFLLAILILACASSSLAFHMIYSAYKLNKQSDNIQPWQKELGITFPVWNPSVVPCPVLTVASWLAYRFLRRHFIVSIFFPSVKIVLFWFSCESLEWKYRALEDKALNQCIVHKHRQQHGAVWPASL